MFDGGMYVVFPVKHGRHIGFMSASSVAVFCCHTFGFRSKTFEGMHQFLSNFKEW